MHPDDEAYLHVAHRLRKSGRRAVGLLPVGSGVDVAAVAMRLAAMLRAAGEDGVKVVTLDGLHLPGELEQALELLDGVALVVRAGRAREREVELAHRSLAPEQRLGVLWLEPG